MILNEDLHKPSKQITKPCAFGCTGVMPFPLVSLLSHLLSRCRPCSPLFSAFFDHELRQCRLALPTCAAAVAPIPLPRACIRAELLDRAPAAAKALTRLASPARAAPVASRPSPRAWIRAELLDRAPAAAKALIRFALPARAAPVASRPSPRLDQSQTAER